jgi:hypothetical protein
VRYPRRSPLTLALALSACAGRDVPPEVLPRVLTGDCTRVTLETSAGPGASELSFASLRIRSTLAAGCGRIVRVEIAGWLDGNRDGRVDPGEALESRAFYTPRGGSEEMRLDGLVLKLPPGHLSDLQLRISVQFESGRITLLEAAAKG